MINDVAMKLASNGDALVIPSALAFELSEAAPDSYRILMISRFLAHFSAPRWGDLFLKGDRQMQTEQQERPANRSELDDKLAKAVGQLETLRSAADDAEADARRWQVTFEREPTAQAHTEAAVSRQRATNARSAAEAYDRDTVQPLLLSKKQAERDSVAGKLEHKEKIVRRRFEAAAEFLCSALREFDGAIEDLAALHEPRVAAKQQGVPLSDFTLIGLVAEVNAKLAEFRGAGMGDIHERHARVSTTDEKNAPLVIAINRPARVPSPLR